MWHVNFKSSSTHLWLSPPPLLYPHPKISLETLPTETVFQILGFALSHKEWTIWGEMGSLRYFWEHAMHSCSKKQCYQSVLWRRVQRFAEKQQKRDLVIMTSLLLGRRSVKPCAMDAFEAKYLSHGMWDRANQGIKFDIEIHPEGSLLCAWASQALHCWRVPGGYSSLSLMGHLTVMDWDQLRVNHSEHILLNGIFTPHFYFCALCSLLPPNCAVSIKRYVAPNAWHSNPHRAWKGWKKKVPSRISACSCIEAQLF